MPKPKFRVGDRVRILADSLQPQYEGVVGIVKKAYQSFTDDGTDGHDAFYRIEVDGVVLRGIAIESELEGV